MVCELSRLSEFLVGGLRLGGSGRLSLRNLSVQCI